MARKITVLVLSIVVILALLLSGLAACAPSPTMTPAEKPTSTPSPAVTPVEKPTSTPSPAVTPSEKPEYGGAIVVRMGGDPVDLDPIFYSQTADAIGIAPAYNTLFMWENPQKPEKLVGDIAESWEYGPDAKTLTIHIHKGILCHDGQPFTAEDVKYSLNIQTNPPKGVVSQRKDLLKAIDSIEVPDKYTVTIKLQYPTGSLLEALTVTKMTPKHWHEKVIPVKYQELVGTGPFTFRSFVVGASLEYQKNKDYFKKGLPYLDRVQLVNIPDPQAALAALRSGRLHSWGGLALTGNDAEVLKKQAPEIVQFHGLSYGYLDFNWVITRKPWSDIRVRQAVSMAVDREAFNQVIYRGLGQVGGYTWPGGPYALPKEELQKYPGYEPDIKARIAKAKQLLTEAGYPDGFTTTMVYRSDPLYTDMAVFVQECLKQIGIKVTLTPADSAVVIAKRTQGDFDLLQFGITQPLGDPDSIWEPQITGMSRNYTGYSNPKIDALYEQQKKELDISKRIELVQEMERITLTEVPRVLYPWTGVLRLTRPEVKGIVPGGGSADPAWNWQLAWLTK